MMVCWLMTSSSSKMDTSAIRQKASFVIFATHFLKSSNFF